MGGPSRRWACSRICFTASACYCVTLPLALFALRQSAGLRAQWHTHRRAIILVGVLSPTAYLLVLLALQTTPLSYVAPVREISMLVGTLLGAVFLKEAVRPSQFVGAAMMLLGVVGLALA